MKTRFARVILAAAAILLFMPSGLLAQDAQSAGAGRGWEVVIYPVFGWAPLYGVDLTLPPVPDPPVCDGCGPGAPSGSASSSGLSGAAFAAFRAEVWRISVAGDFNYAGLTAEKERPFMRVKTQLITGAIVGGFRVAGPWFLEAGARRHALDIDATILEYPQVNWKPARWEAIVGTTVRPQLSETLRLYAHLDYGGFGGDLSTLNGAARVEWRPIRHLALTGGYAFVTFELDDQILRRPVHLKQTLHGPLVGIGIPF